MSDFKDFWDNYFGAGFCVAIIIGLVVLVFGILLWGDSVDTDRKHYDLYRTVQNEQYTKDKNLIDSATFIRSIINNTDTETQFDNISKFYSSNSSDFGYFLKNKDLFIKVANGEITDISQIVKIKTWSTFFLNLALFFWIVYALSCTINLISSCRKNSTEIWNWPWYQIWPFFLIITLLPVFLPYLIISQLYHFIRVKFFKKIFCRNRNYEAAKKKAIKDLKNLKEDVDKVRKRWKKNFIQNSDNKLKNLSDEISWQKTRLSELGADIKETQISLAKNQKELVEWQKNAESIKNQSLVDYMADFEAIQNLNNVSAVDIHKDTLIVYTTPVVVKYLGQKYEIGIIGIEINIKQAAYIRFHSLCSSHPDGRIHPYYGNNFCWGSLDNVIREALRNREFASAIILILQAIYSAEGDSPRKITEYKEV